MTQRRILVLSVVVYGVFSVIGLFWASAADRAWVFRHPAPWLELDVPWALGSSLFAGIAIALVTIAATRILVRRARWASELHVAFREMLGPLPARTIAVLAIASGVGEEIFFRGAMQPSLGIVLTSIVFGAVHIGPDRRFIVWTLWAMLMGFILGAVHEATGSLLGPIVAHVAINYENLQFICAYDPRDPADEASHLPRLVGREERR